MLYLATIAEDGALGRSATIAGGAAESIFQPEWSPDGARLVFVSDRSGWWNLYAVRAGDAAPSARSRRWRRSSALPQWVFGMTTYAFAGSRPDRLRVHAGGLGSSRRARSAERRTACARYAVHRIRVGARRRRPRRVPRRRARPPGQHRGARSWDRPAQRPETGRPTFSTRRSPPRRLSHRAESVEFPTTGGETAFALFYPPHNPDYAGPAGEKPPLLVKCHGGPTSAASSTLNLGIQYWTSRGIAVLDVNYRGSTGFGRAYRDRLDGAWGVVDVDDASQGAGFLAARGWVDGKRMRHHRRQRRRLHHARGADVPRLLPGRRELLRRERRRRAGARHAQIRIALSRLADRTLSAGGGALSRALADLACGPAGEAGDLLPGRRGCRRAAEPDRDDGRRAAPQGQSGRLFPVRRRAARLPQGREHPARLDAELAFYAIEVFRTGLTF